MKLKQIKYFILISLMLSSVIASALDGDTIRIKPPVQKKVYPTPPLILKTNPLAILWGPIPFTAEYRLVAEVTTGRKQSSQIGISFLTTSPLWKTFEAAANIPTKYHFIARGWRIQVSHKFFLIGSKKYAPFGFYISPNVSYTNAHISIGLQRYYRQNYLDFRHFNANILVGMQIGKNSRFTMDIFGGMGYKKNTVLFHANSFVILPYDMEEFGKFYNSNLKLVFGINFGYAIY
ncbi:MAG: hypothetical protein K8R85_02460 [Bacteroidetes bacterium]|nr:hypothetical protein [Bacteroidota bacterium]